MKSDSENPEETKYQTTKLFTKIHSDASLNTTCILKGFQGMFEKNLQSSHLLRQGCQTIPRGFINLRSQLLGGMVTCRFGGSKSSCLLPHAGVRVSMLKMGMFGKFHGCGPSCLGNAMSFVGSILGEHSRTDAGWTQRCSTAEFHHNVIMWPHPNRPYVWGNPPKCCLVSGIQHDNSSRDNTHA